MIKIYSADAETGKLFTDEKQRFYLDAQLLRERRIAIRTEYLLDRIAKALGYKSHDEMMTSIRCSGVTQDTLDAWITSGKLIKNLKHMI